MKKKKRKILGLLWDDDFGLDPHVRAVVSSLKADNIEIEGFHNSSDFLRALRDNLDQKEGLKVSFVILDALDGDGKPVGLELAVECRTHVSDIPIFFLSGTRLEATRWTYFPSYIFLKEANAGSIAYLMAQSLKFMGLSGQRIFIGHGRSDEWRKLRDHLKDLGTIEPIEFDSENVAGQTVTNRLTTMMKDSALAFIVMTGEDENIDSKLSARPNVIHELGFFQGYLGFDKTIILKENGIETLSNIQGIVYIEFPRGAIESCFKEVDEVLKREGLLEN